MLHVLICKCSNALPKARKFLQEHGVDNWLDVPLDTGKESVSRFLSSLADNENLNPSVVEIRNFLADVSRFIIFIDYNDDYLEWADISHGDPNQIIKAESILERFA